MVNRVEVSGRLTRDPEVKYLGEYRFPVASLNIAVDDGVGRWNRETKKTEYGSGFYQVEVVGQYGEFVANWASRGDEVYVVGSLSQFSTGGRDGGETKTHTRIKATVVQVLNAPSGFQAQQIAPPPEPEVDPWEVPQTDAGGF